MSKRTVAFQCPRAGLRTNIAVLSHKQSLCIFVFGDSSHHWRLGSVHLQLCAWRMPFDRLLSSRACDGRCWCAGIVLNAHSAGMHRAMVNELHLIWPANKCSHNMRKKEASAPLPTICFLYVLIRKNARTKHTLKPPNICRSIALHCFCFELTYHPNKKIGTHLMKIEWVAN